MRKYQIVFCYVFWLLSLYFVFSLNILANAEILENQKWSFDFKNCTVSDALRQMSQATGIDFFMNQNRDDQVCKSYNEQTIDQILRNLFKHENYAMLWSYDDEGLSTIDIWILKDSSSRANFAMQQLSGQRLMKKEKDKVVSKTDFKQRVESSQFDKTGVNKSVSSQSNKGNLTKKEPNKLFVYRNSKASGSGNMLTNPEPTVPDDDKAQEVGEADSGDVSEVNFPIPIPMPQVSNPESNDTAEGIAEEEDQTAEAVPPPALPEKWHDLEPPPMPPGF